MYAYYRVSTLQQGRSGLGLEAQQAAVAAYAASVGSRVVAEFTEVESGRHSDRPQLAMALARAKRAKGKLVVAKLDRLSRNAHFLTGLMEAKVPFVCCDNPAANELTIGILAMVAQQEAKDISERTKAALAATKARGTKLGAAREGFWTPEREARRQEGQRKATAASSVSRSKAAREAYSDLLPGMLRDRAAGLSLRKIAARLNEQGHTTRNGKAWHANQVKLVLDRAGGSVC